MLVSEKAFLVLLALAAVCRAQTFTLKDVPSLASDPTLTAFDEEIFNAGNADCDPFGTGQDIGYYDVPSDTYQPVHIACGDKSQFPARATKCATPPAGSGAALLVQNYNHGLLYGIDDTTTTKYTCTTQNCANNGCNVIPKFYYLNSNACNPQNGEELVITTAFGQSYPDCASPGSDGTSTSVPVPGPDNGHGVAAVIRGSKVMGGFNTEELILCDPGFMPVGTSCILAASQAPRRFRRGRFLKRNAPLPGY